MNFVLITAMYVVKRELRKFNNCSAHTSQFESEFPRQIVKKLEVNKALTQLSICTSRWTPDTENVDYLKFMIYRLLD